MPAVARSREIAASIDEIWRFAVEPRNLAKWWPGTASVKAVRGSAGVGQTWRQVFSTKKGSEVSAHQICSEFETRRRWAFDQRTEGTAFEKVLRSARVELDLHAADSGTEVTLRLERRMRGMSALGGLFVRRASVRTVRQALDGLSQQLIEKAAK